jgi:hypothetical protein
MKLRRTRRAKTKKQRGGFYTPEDKARISTNFASKPAPVQAQIQHCVSQLKRFAPCIQTNPLRSYQFFYNLGRLQELLGETTGPKLWWTPIETLVTEGKYSDISTHIDSLKDIIGVAYDDALIAKGC